MKKISLKNIENTLSRNEMRKIKGGYSWLYCTWNSFAWPWSPGGMTAAEYDACRAA